MDGIGFRAERVLAPSGRVGWTVVDANGAAVAPAEAFLRYRFACEASPNTLRAYAHDLKLFFGFLAERALSWRELSPAELGEFVAWLRRPAENVIPLPGTPPARAASTVNRALSAVMAFYDFHRLQGVELADLMFDPQRGGRGAYRPFLAGIARDRARGRRGRLPVARRAPRALSLEQVAQVVAAQSRLRDRLLFVLLFTTGMRIGQALGLRHSDVRLWKRELAIVPREDNANGARGKRGSGVVPLTEEAARLYLLYMEHEYGLLDSDYVFVNLWGGELGRPLPYAAVSRLVARTRKRVGFEFTPHDFRHTFVTLARRGGVRLEVISRLVTHRSVTTTADVYSHLELEELRAELEGAGPARLGRGGYRVSRERPVLAAVPAHEEARWQAAVAARVRPEFRVDRYLPPREHLVLYGPHCSVAGCDSRRPTPRQKCTTSHRAHQPMRCLTGSGA